MVKFGATGDYPQGKLNPDDQGGLRLGITVTPDGLVRIEFGKPVVWLALSQADAMQLAMMIISNARNAGPQ